MKSTQTNKTTSITLSFLVAMIVALLTVPTITVAEGIPDISPDIRMEKDSSLICMVTNRFMGSEQLPVDFDGKTYYGCCGGCVNKIIRNEAVRTGKDPVSGASVDKATAVIGIEKGGAVLYFESEETFDEYLKKGTKALVE